MERSIYGARKEQQVPIGVFDHERLGPLFHEGPTKRDPCRLKPEKGPLDLLMRVDPIPADSKLFFKPT